MQNIIEGTGRKYFSINKDSSYKEHQTLDLAIKSTDFFTLVIKYDHYVYGSYTNEYFNFDIYNAAGEATDTIELNGWKMKFRGPIMDRHWYNQYRTFICTIADPIDPENFVHVENLYIGEEDFATAVRRLISISEHQTKSIVNLLWKIEVLTEETIDLERKREEQYKRASKLEKELESLKG